MKWEVVARALVNRTRMEMWDLIAAQEEEKFSPKRLADASGVALGTVSYHVRELHAVGLLTRVGSRQVRGATEHFYVVSKKVRG